MYFATILISTVVAGGINWFLFISLSSALSHWCLNVCFLWSMEMTCLWHSVTFKKAVLWCGSSVRCVYSTPHIHKPPGFNALKTLFCSLAGLPLHVHLALYLYGAVTLYRTYHWSLWDHQSKWERWDACNTGFFYLKHYYNKWQTIKSNLKSGFSLIINGYAYKRYVL